MSLLHPRKVIGRALLVPLDSRYF